MGNCLEQLVEIGSAQLCSVEPKLSEDASALAGSLSEDLVELLQKKNGFYAFESALHIFPSISVGKEIGLELWNSPTLWKDSYKGLTQDYLFFAEDVFGGQFCIRDNMVCTFEPETGKIEQIANNFEDWAKLILCNFQVLTGYTLAHQWQEINGPIPSGMRLVPKIPFVLGGEFHLENLCLLDSVRAMHLRGEIAIQIRDTPDGAKIRFSVREDHSKS